MDKFGHLIKAPSASSHPLQKRILKSSLLNAYKGSQNEIANRISLV